MPEARSDHPFLPSGAWAGFYLYGQGAAAPPHEMEMWLNFNAGEVHGSGMDDVGFFSWEGAYQLEPMTCNLVKFYASHQVWYHGRIDENGIWGHWNLDSLRGGFHIWPKKQAVEEHAEQARVAEPAS